ncbi:ORF V, partial [Chelydra serpentina]
QGPFSRATSTSGGANAPGYRGNRGGSKGAERQEVLLPLFPNPQVEGGVTSHPSPSRTQQIHGKVEVPNAFPGDYYPLTGDWYAALDMKDAYFHIAIYPPQRHFLRFVVNQQHFQFTVLPFGLSTAPRVFTKCMAVVAASLCQRRNQVFPYLDDWLFRSSSSSQVQSHV